IIVVVVTEPVEPPYFIRTVVGAIFRSNATVVGHLIQTFGTVRGGQYRTYRFARRIIAMLTQHGLVGYTNMLIRIEIIVFFLPGGVIAFMFESIIPVDAYPVHFSSSAHFVATN